MSSSKLKEAWSHLDRAHLLAQAYPVEHTYIHYKMLQFGIKINSRKEIIIQIPRLLVGGIISFFGQIPTGNTGISNVSPRKKIPINLDIIEILKKARIQI